MYKLSMLNTLGNNEYVNIENNLSMYNTNMANVPRYIKIGTNLAISKSSKNKIKKAYGLKFRGKTKKQQKEMVMRQAKELRGGARKFRNEKYAWRFLAQSYNVALKPIRKQAIERKKRELKRYNVNITIKWTGYMTNSKTGSLEEVRSGEISFTDTLRRREIEKWKNEKKEEVKNMLDDSPFDKLDVEIISGNELEVKKSVPLTYRTMRVAGVLDLDNMVENDIWCKNRNMCVPDFIQYRYGNTKGFKKLCSDEKIEFWATHIYDPNEYQGYIVDYELEHKEMMNPNKDGYCIQHLHNWCLKAKVNMYALVDGEVIHTTFPDGAREKRSLPLVFEMKNNHLYPVIETKKIKQITNKPKSEILKEVKSNTQQLAKDPDDVEEKEDPELDIEFMDMKLYESLDDKTKLNYALEVMSKTNKMTYPKNNLCLYQGSLSSFKLGNTKHILQRPPLEAEEEEEGISKTALLKDAELKAVMEYCEEKGIQFNGQTPPYFTKQNLKAFQHRFSSYFAEDVEAALSREVKNRTHIGKVHRFDWSYSEDRKMEKALWSNALSYDINKCYRSVMIDPIEPFMIIDFDNVICNPPKVEDIYPIGLYYVKTMDNLLFHYDNWYSSGMINYALKNTEIEFHVEAYIPAKGLDENPLFNLIEVMKTDFHAYPKMLKLVINSIYGYLMKTTTNNTYLNVDEDASRVYDTYVKVAGLHNRKLTALEFSKYETQNGKTLYTYGNRKKIKIKSTNLPMGIQINDQANIKLYELQKQMMISPNCYLLYRNTDNVIIGYLNDDEKEIVEKKIICTDEVGGVSVKAIPNEPYNVYYPEKSYERRRYYWRYENPKWNDIPYNDSDDWLDIITEMVQKGGGMLLGRAGTGKSYVCKKGMKHYEDQGYTTKALAFTNKATIQLKGSTIHKFMTIDKEGKLNVKWAREQSKNIDLIFVDEISMISKHLWKILAEFKYYTGIPFILIGDYRQLPPVDSTISSWKDYFNHPTIKWLSNYNRCELNQMKRYDIKLWNLLEDVWENKIWTKSTQDYFSKVNKRSLQDLIDNKNICYSNKTRKSINEMVQNAIKPDDAVLIEYSGIVNKYNQDMYLFPGAKLIMYLTTKDTLFKKNEEVEVVSFTDKTITITNGEEQSVYDYINKNGKNKIHEMFLVGYATTIHKSQGDTVNGDVNIFDINLLRSGFIGDLNSRKALYTALSRARSLENIKISKL